MYQRIRSREIPTSCPNPGSCGTFAPVWINETTNEACVTWKFQETGDVDCCLFTLPVKIKSCPDFKVYHLGPTYACSVAYCTEQPKTSVNDVLYDNIENQDYVELTLKTLKDGGAVFVCKTNKKFSR